MLILLVIIVFAIIGFFGCRSLIEKKYWRELIVFSVILFMGFVLFAMQSLEIKIPSPGEGVKLFVEQVLHLGYK